MARTKGGSSMRGKKRPAVTAKKPIQKAKTKIKPRAKKATKKQLPAPSTRATKAPRGPVVARGTIKATKKSTKRAPKVTPKNKKLGGKVTKAQKAEAINAQLRKAISATLANCQQPPVAKGKGSKKKQAVKSKSYKLDSTLSSLLLSGNKVYKDYSSMLNQTNIGFNNNKFYVIQIAVNSAGSTYTFFTRWGRVGEQGKHSLVIFKKVGEAEMAFEKKFRDKTSNHWRLRANFSPMYKKYTPLEIDEESDDEDDNVKVITIGNPNAKSCLDERTQKLARLIFNDTMFTQQMANMNLDVKKMPLGKLSKAQIAKGLEALLDIEEAMKEKKGLGSLNQLSSKFYTLIPHNFGRRVPPAINATSIVQKKEMLITLADIELTQNLQKKKQATVTQNPMDAKMEALSCTLDLVDRKSKEFKWIEGYSKACSNTRKNNLLDVWRLDREGEHHRFAKNAGIEYRKLLWHGTNVAVVAAILNSGLRIMPHSGGRVGRGIYFASEHGKSSWYVGAHNGSFEGEKNIGFMFLVEVALGKMNNIKQSDGSQTVAPPGFDSIVARGSTEPDSKDEMELKYDGNKVIVPRGKPMIVPKYEDSRFSQSEYLVYREDQARLRYLLKFSFH